MLSGHGPGDGLHQLSGAQEVAGRFLHLPLPALDRSDRVDQVSRTGRLHLQRVQHRQRLVVRQIPPVVHDSHDYTYVGKIRVQAKRLVEG